MGLFTYRAMDPHGQIVRGHMESSSLAELEARLQRLELDLIHGSDARSHWRWQPRPVPRRELINLCFQLEQLLGAGVPVTDSLNDLADAIRQPRLRQVVADLASGIEGGASLSQALAQHPDVFDAVFCNLVRAGEYSGRLPEVLRALCEAFKRDDELAAYARRMAIYPAIVGLMVLAALGVALVYVVPELARLFQTAGLPLPWQTRLLIALSRGVTHYGALLLFATAAAALALRQALGRPALRLRYDAAILRVPVLGALRSKIAMARFSGLFAMMYASGITVLDALRAAENVVGNTALQAGLRQAGRSIEDGRSVSEAFAEVSHFPPLVTRMIRVGERTGGLDKALSNVSYFYDRDVREAIEKLQAGIEPALTLILGGLLLAVMSAVMMPVYDIVTRLKF
ncbi:type II secretion system F family protein [Zoogloea dura]|uniref:Type II secretion system F family protein n=1 Tax=Zoogloea dura TaxID=2728840 RepID=A0A848GBE7_9RHOO|nr:type II secretion system F family protein [Zoogloea dura]NML26841.1 type II secretion system F family protein [Zoogloea dura]